MVTTSCRKSSWVKSSSTESRSSDRKLKPLPPDPFRHQNSAIAQRTVTGTQETFGHCYGRTHLGSVPVPSTPDTKNKSRGQTSGGQAAKKPGAFSKLFAEVAKIASREVG